MPWSFQGCPGQDDLQLIGFAVTVPFMDFGLGELFKVLEKHFGKPAAKLLVGLAAIAVAGVCLKLIYNDIIVPVYSVNQDNSLRQAWVLTPEPIDLALDAGATFDNQTWDGDC